MLGENNNFSARHTFSVYDPTPKFSFLVDSGSDVCAAPAGWIKREVRAHKTLQGPTLHSNVSCVGYANLTLDIGFARKFPWRFAICKSLMQPILGADFMKNYSLLIDPTNKRLLEMPNKSKRQLKNLK